jgi:hypothetical protein
MSVSKSPTEDQVASPLNWSGCLAAASTATPAAEAEAQQAQPVRINAVLRPQELDHSKGVLDLLIDRGRARVAIALAKATKADAEGGNAALGQSRRLARVHAADLILAAPKAMQHDHRWDVALYALRQVQGGVNAPGQDDLSLCGDGRRKQSRRDSHRQQNSSHSALPSHDPIKSAAGPLRLSIAPEPCLRNTSAALIRSRWGGPRLKAQEQVPHVRHLPSHATACQDPPGVQFGGDRSEARRT